MKDTNATGRILTFSRTITFGGKTYVTKASTLGVTTKMEGTLLPGRQTTIVKAPEGDVMTYESSFRDRVKTSSSGLGSTRTTYVNDARVTGPRRVERQRFTSPLGSVDNFTKLDEDYTLADASDPFSVQSARFTSELNGDITVTTFDGASRSLVTTSPMGRTATTVINGAEWITQTRWANLLPVNYAYDSAGRLVSVSQGTRSSLYQYGSDGNLALSTDALGRTTAYAYDPVGRLTRMTLPDGRRVSFGYNARGLLSSSRRRGGPPRPIATTPSIA